MLPKNKALRYGCIGCGIPILIGMVLIVSCVGYVGYSGYQMGKEIETTYNTMFDQYQNLVDKYPFTPPEDGVISEERYKDYLAIRTKLSQNAEGILGQLETKGEAIGEKFESKGIASKIEGIGSIKDMIKFVVTMPAKVADEHILLLEEQEMSPFEYKWITSASVGALYKSEKNQYGEGAELWEKYLEKFNDDRQNFQGIQSNNGSRRIEGKDINPRNLKKKLEETPFVKSNAEKMVSNQEEIMSASKATVLDFMALYFDEIMESINQG